MRVLKTLAVDDEGPALRRLIKMAEAHSGLSLTGSAKSAMEAKEKIMELQPELLLLDIQLKDATAFDLLYETKNDFNGKIIFITAYDQYAVKAFEHDAVDYLLKPYTQERFSMAVDRVIQRDKKPEFNDMLNFLNDYIPQSKTLIIPEGTRNYFIEKEKLMYMISEGYYTHFILCEGKTMIRISLKRLGEILPENFVRVNKSVIINMNFIKESIHNKATAKVIMKDHNEFYISDSFMNEYKKAVRY